ncbi:MAG TPA: type VII secretion integral membrane protein EccD [Vineibacter sp.]|nr:type VII secretion integral membrane protein EccD [Vineibacter sp.]
MSELRTVEVVSAAPEGVRVSVLGGRTQLDVALPADVPVAAFLPELAELIGSRGAVRGSDALDVTDRDERRTFWTLSRIDGDAVLAPDETLRAAGVSNGELLRISARQALSPPMLHDDVVDAAAQLNRAAYAAWNAAAAKVMAFVGLWLCGAVWVVFLMAGGLSAHRTVVVVGAAFTVLALVAGAAVVRRVLEQTDVATAAGWPALAITAALAWVLAAPYGARGLVVACAVLLTLIGVYYRVVGVGHWAYIAAAVVFAFAGLSLLSRMLGGPIEVVAAVTTTIAVLGCLVLPTLTTRLTRLPAADSSAAQSDHPFDSPFTSASATSSGAAMPSAEEVWARVRSAALTRAGLQSGLAAVVVVGATVLLRTRTELSAFTFALVCAAVIALRSRRASTWMERAALAGPATALILVACVQSQAGPPQLQMTGVGVLVAVAALASYAGVVASQGRGGPRVSTAAAYADYIAVASLVPLALWPLGVYDRLGPW